MLTTFSALLLADANLFINLASEEKPKEEITMMPLTYINPGETAMIQRVGGNSDVKRHLETLGFVPGGNISVISALNGNIIVDVKGARIAISREMAQKVFAC